MSDAARELVEEALVRIGRIARGGVGDKDGYIFYANDVRLVLDELARKVRLDEAKIWRDNTYSINMESNEWRIKRLEVLEQAAGGSAAGSEK